MLFLNTYYATTFLLITTLVFPLFLRLIYKTAHTTLTNKA